VFENRQGQLVGFGANTPLAIAHGEHGTAAFDEPSSMSLSPVFLVHANGSTTVRGRFSMQISSAAGAAIEIPEQEGASAEREGLDTQFARDVVERFALMTVEEVRGRYAIGKQVLAMLSEHVPIARLAKIAGLSTKALYQHGVVVKRFGEEELNHWLTRRNVHGQPPTWSHFVLLCSIASRSARAAILEQWLANPIGIRELTARLRVKTDGAVRNNGSQVDD
jgi:hypothetical protein